MKQYEKLGFASETYFEFPNIINCYSAHCMRRKRAEIVKFNVLHTSWKATRSASKSMRLFMSMDIP